MDFNQIFGGLRANRSSNNSTDLDRVALVRVGHAPGNVPLTSPSNDRIVWDPTH